MQVSPFVLGALVLAACASPQRVERSESRTSHVVPASGTPLEPLEVPAGSAPTSGDGDGPAKPTPDTIHCGNPVVGAVADQSTSGGERISTNVPCWTVPAAAPGTPPDRRGPERGDAHDAHDADKTQR